MTSYYNHFTHTSAASILAIKLSKKASQQIMLWNINVTQCWDKLTVTDNYTIKIIIIKKIIPILFIYQSVNYSVRKINKKLNFSLIMKMSEIIKRIAQMYCSNRQEINPEEISNISYKQNMHPIRLHLNPDCNCQLLSVMKRALHAIS